MHLRIAFELHTVQICYGSYGSLVKADGACSLAVSAHTQSVLQCCKPREVSLQYNSNPLMLNGVWTHFRLTAMEKEHVAKLVWEPNKSMILTGVHSLLHSLRPSKLLQIVWAPHKHTASIVMQHCDAARDESIAANVQVGDQSGLQLCRGLANGRLLCHKMLCSLGSSKCLNIPRRLSYWTHALC